MLGVRLVACRYIAAEARHEHTQSSGVQLWGSRLVSYMHTTTEARAAT